MFLRQQYDRHGRTGFQEHLDVIGAPRRRVTADDIHHDTQGVALTAGPRDGLAAALVDAQNRVRHPVIESMSYSKRARDRYIEYGANVATRTLTPAQKRLTGIGSYGYFKEPQPDVIPHGPGQDAWALHGQSSAAHILSLGPKSQSDTIRMASRVTVDPDAIDGQRDAMTDFYATGPSRLGTTMPRNIAKMRLNPSSDATRRMLRQHQHDTLVRDADIAESVYGMRLPQAAQVIHDHPVFYPARDPADKLLYSKAAMFSPDPTADVADRVMVASADRLIEPLESREAMYRDLAKDLVDPYRDETLKLRPRAPAAQSASASASAGLKLPSWYTM